MKRKQMNRKIFFCTSAIGIVVAMLMIFASCKEDMVGQPPTSGAIPSPVTNVRTEPIPGGAILMYDIPNETDIAYVMCEYSVRGETKIVRSSIYTNQVIIEGLGGIAPCDFTLYLVNHSENRSQPHRGSFIPLEPPYLTIFNTLEAEPDFGGVVIRWANEHNALIGAFLLAVDDYGRWEEFSLAFSTLSSDRRSIRGYNTEARMFGAVLIDRFGNRTDTFRIVAEPLFERELDKSRFRDGYLLGDNNSVNQNRPLSNIWNGRLEDGQIWHTVAGDPSGVPPQTFTIDLGVRANLSRMMLWNRTGGSNQWVWSQHNPRFFEVWGTTELKYPFNNEHWRSGPWQDDWIFLGDFETVKPSGLPVGINTEEDIAAERAGHEFMFEPGTGEIQYLRFVVKETWQRTAALHIMEISIFGDDGVRDE
jgi:hypothetical protein